MVFRRQLNKPLCWDLGPNSLERLPLKISSKMNQNNLELCKTTEFWWVDRPEPLKNQNWQRSLEWTGEILRSYESNNTEKIVFDEKNIKSKPERTKKTNWKTNTKGKKQEKPKRKLRILVSCFFLVFFCFFWWFFLSMFVFGDSVVFFGFICFAKIHFLCSTRGHNAREQQKLN